MTEVVAALIWDKDKFMICQRPANKARGMLWEFVGGKVEPGETLRQALKRECREELDITVAAGEVFMDVVHEYSDVTIHLTLFYTAIIEGVPQKLEHNDIRWITVDEIPQYEFCPADETILRELERTRKLSVNEALDTLAQDNYAGIYQIYIRDIDAIRASGICPQLCDEVCLHNNEGLIYIGQAQGRGMLRSRLRQELLGAGRGTLFRSIGAILGESPRLARNQREIMNYVFEEPAHSHIKAFIQENLVVQLKRITESIDVVETRLIWLSCPPLNINKNPVPWKYLIDQRERCRSIAAGNAPVTIYYNKLVRDRIPEIIEASGKTCTTEILSDEDYLKMLDKKLDEELAEYHADQNIEELADLMEVIRACAIARGYSVEELERVRAEKAAKRGGFEKKALLKTVEER